MKRIALAGLLAALASGCGSNPSKPVSVSGTVTLEGKPLAGAQVTFSPAAGGNEKDFGTDVTGTSGYYQIMSHGRSGVPPGKYRVLISRAEAGAGLGDGGDPIMLALMAKARVGEAGGPDITPIEGRFDREVEPSGSTLDFDLKRPPKAELRQDLRITPPPALPGPTKAGKKAKVGQGRRRP